MTTPNEIREYIAKEGYDRELYLRVQNLVEYLDKTDNHELMYKSVRDVVNHASPNRFMKSEHLGTMAAHAVRMNG